jgi:hypothetical protein
MAVDKEEIGKWLDPATLEIGNTYIFEVYPRNYGPDYGIVYIPSSITRGILRGKIKSEITGRIGHYFLIWDVDGVSKHAGAYQTPHVPGQVEAHEDLSPIIKKAQENALVDVAASGTLPAHLVKNIGAKYLGLRGGRKSRKTRRSRRLTKRRYK